MDAKQTAFIYRTLAERFEKIISDQSSNERMQQEALLEGLDTSAYVAKNGKRQRVFFSLADLGRYTHGFKASHAAIKRLVDKHKAFGVVNSGSGKASNKYRIPHTEAVRLAIDSGMKSMYQRKPGQKVQVWVVNNLKGGSGKSTSCANLSAGLGTEGKVLFRVGVIDLDPQGSLTAMMAPHFDPEKHFSVGDILRGKYALDDGETYQDFVKSSFLETNLPNVKILPARELDNLYNTEPRSDIHLALEPIIEAMQDEVDIIMIDTPPNINDVVIAAHYSATSVLMPLRPQQNDRDGTYKYLRTFAEMYEAIARLGHKGYDQVRMMAVDHDPNSYTDKEMLREIRWAGASSMLPDFLHSEAVKKCAFKGKTVFEISGSEYSKTVENKTLYGSRESLENAQDNLRNILNVLEGDIVTVWDFANEPELG